MGLIRQHALYAGESLDAPQLLELGGARAAVFTRRGPHKTTGNQDAAAVISAGDSARILAVADGLGGLPGGDQAAALAIRRLLAQLEAAPEGRLRETILDAIEQANREILALGIGAATTLVVAEIRGNCLRTYHIGDAGALVTGQRGRLRLQTSPHSPTGYAQEAGLMEEVEALNHDERNLVSNVLGSRELRIEMGPLLKLAPRDTLVLASDGLFDNLLSDEIVQWVRCGALAHVAATLAETVSARMQGLDAGAGPGHPDDLSFIVYRRN